jgi:hypothetical protein
MTAHATGEYYDDYECRQCSLEWSKMVQDCFSHRDELHRSEQGMNVGLINEQSETITQLRAELTEARGKAVELANGLKDCADMVIESCEHPPSVIDAREYRKTAADVLKEWGTE